MKRTSVSVFIVTMLATVTAHAQLDVYLDRASWEVAAGGSPIVENFNDVAPFIFADGEVLMTSKLSVTRDGSPNAADGLLEIEDGGAFGNIDATNFLSGETGIEPHEEVAIGFLGSSVSAFGGDFFSPFSGDGIALQVGSEVVLLDSIAGFDIGFVGVVSNSPFDEVRIVGNPETLSFQELWSADNLSFVAVPEPGGLLMLIVGVVLVSLMRRR